MASSRRTYREGILPCGRAWLRGFLAVTAVLTSLYPAVTIVLARTVLGERLTALRLAGLGLAGVCVSLIAVGGAS